MSLAFLVPGVLPLLLTACGTKLMPTAAMPASPARTELRVGHVRRTSRCLTRIDSRCSSSSFRGKTVQVAFYVWAFSGG